MDIIKNFGVNPVLLGAQIVNFLIIFFILKKFLYKPILELLRKRQTTIKEGLKQAEEAKVRLEKVIVEEKNILRQAQIQAKKIIEDTKQESIEITKNMTNDAKKLTEKMLGEAKNQIIRESMETEKRLALKVSKLAVSFLEKSLKNFFSGSQQEEVLKNVLKKIKKTA
ncbi:MAG: F0F1 ATP synthase subunit B [Candidatus Levybacteria bacterium]|nr:F0F1 ATP synthase subunit B [Candidatus Levybacteria bacterium]